MPGLGLIPGSLSVHRDSEPERLPAYREAVAAGVLPDGWAVDDGAALLVRDQTVARVVASRPGAGAERVSRAATGGVRAAGPPSCSRARARAQSDPALEELRAVRELQRGLGSGR